MRRRKRPGGGSCGSTARSRAVLLASALGPFLSLSAFSTFLHILTYGCILLHHCSAGFQAWPALDWREHLGTQRRWEKGVHAARMRIAIEATHCFPR